MNNPEKVIFSVTMQDILSALSRRTDLSKISETDLQLVIQEVQAVLETELDPRPYIDMGLDVWEITRKL